ncbi:hypothetical protein CEXT_519901 [Caerostris extrusa]|uniref:Uncharacterized protein n=1 Tax=Caerostris extrusa TaxID=172846 RepID=A0AAV4X7K4_CAEEX|nr:hypothetical protein CEXT_519901 [Caerostris extrusa]
MNSIWQHICQTKFKNWQKELSVYNLPVDRQSKSKLHFPTQADAYKDEKGSFQPGEYPSAPESSPESEVAVPYFPPSNNYPEVYKSKSGTGYSSSDESMYKSESNANYNVWKGFPSESGEYEAPVTGMKGVPPSFEDFQFPSDSWNKDKMAAMITLMNEMKEEAKTQT